MVECRLCKRRVNWEKGEGYQSVKDGEFLCSAECKVAELLVRLSDTSVLYSLARADVARLTGERDALERSKAENDERFQIERDGARAECDALRRELEELRGAK